VTDPSRVCVVSTSVAFGGAEAYLARIVAGLREEFEFAAVVPDEAATQTVELLTSAGAAIERVHGLRRLPSPRGIRSMTSALRRLRPDLMHVNLTDQRDGGSPLVASRIRRIPSVATLNLVIPAKTTFKERLGSAVLRRADAVIAVSNAVGDYVRGLGVEPRVVRQGLGAPTRNPDPRRALGISSDQLVVGGVGRLHHQKGWDVLCAAAERVHRVRSDVRFMVIGEGPGGDTLRASPGCGHVEFMGPRADAASLVGAFDLLAVPSRYEAFGLVALEAMLSGVPVIASRTGGLVEVVEDGGRLVPPENPGALAEAVLELISDDAARERLALAGRERARREFGLERMIDETRVVYAELCSSGCPRT